MERTYSGLPIDSFTSSEARRLGLLDEAACSDVSIGSALREMINSTTASGPQRRRVGLSALTMRRDLTAATASAGGYLVNTSSGPLQSLLQRYSIFANEPLSFVGPFDGPAVIPVVGTRPAASWIASEGTSISQSEPVFGQIALAPHYLSIYVKASRQLLVQSGRAAEDAIEAVTGDAIARGLDAALLNGSGAAGEPTGLLNVAGTVNQSGTGLAAAGVASMIENVLGAGAREDRLVFFAHPDVRSLLTARPEVSGGTTPLWRDGRMLGVRVVATACVPSKSLVLLDPSRIVVSTFSGGAALESDPYSSFRSGHVSYRVILPVAWGFGPPGAFAKAVSIT